MKNLYFDLSQLVSVCHSISRGGVLLVDAAIAATHGARLQKDLGYDMISVPSGEKHKTRETKQNLEDELFQRKVGRDTLLVAVGGGVTTDLVAFLASTYMRGVPLALIPTSLLAMVDAAIGGKTGVNTPFGKNTVGSFYLPKAIFIDLSFLKTLPEKERENGLSEILKYGLIAKETIWAKASHWKTELPFLIRASIQCKIEVVEKDLEEKLGLRRILNFGHTIGHALETVSQYQMPHGEAVALGCVAEAHLSMRLGYLSEKEFAQIVAVYRRLALKWPEAYSHAQFFSAMAHDKKSLHGEVRFVLIDKIGHAIPFDGAYCRPVTQNELEPTLAWMETWNSSL